MLITIIDGSVKKLDEFFTISINIGLIVGLK
jgi:hypothetical protein